MSDMSRMARPTALVISSVTRSEAGTTQGQDIHLIGAGNSAGQAAMFFADHARTVTLLVRGNSLEKSMSRYLIEQIRGKPNIRGRCTARCRPCMASSCWRPSTWSTGPLAAA